MRRLCLTAVAVVLASLSALAQPTYDRWALADSIDAVLGERAFGPAHWGAHVVDLETGEVYYSRDAYASFIPASNMKLLSTAAALDALRWLYATPPYDYGPAPWYMTEGGIPPAPKPN